MIRDMAIQYNLPSHWIAYDKAAIQEHLVNAKAVMHALTELPYQRAWADELQKIQLKREVAGTSRIEGAEFTERELDDALREPAPHLETRSQRQAAAAVATYRWLATLPADLPVDDTLILEVHRRIVNGCDDDHCPPGRLRAADENVTFGTPRHRGVDGGRACADALHGLVTAVQGEFPAHDQLVQALAVHYHFAAMHPFLDGNGRTARALEALMLQRVGLRDTLFIAMSNYYYEEKTAYLNALTETRAGGHDLTPFLYFALKGVEIQCRRLFKEIRLHISKALYRNTVTDLFGRLKSPRKRVMTERQVQLLYTMLDSTDLGMSVAQLQRTTRHFYTLKNPIKAFVRDLGYLEQLNAVTVEEAERGEYRARINLEWPTQITETVFFERLNELPKGKVYGFLSK